jgi:hypothetical protein
MQRMQGGACDTASVADVDRVFGEQCAQRIQRRLGHRGHEALQQAPLRGRVHAETRPAFAQAQLRAVHALPACVLRDPEDGRGLGVAVVEHLVQQERCALVGLNRSSSSRNDSVSDSPRSSVASGCSASDTSGSGSHGPV